MMAASLFPRFLVALCLAAAAPLAMADAAPSRPVPAPDKAARVERFALLPEGVEPLRLVLGLPDAAAIDAAKSRNSTPGPKALQIGIGREVPPYPESRSASLAWHAVPGGRAAHWEVISPGAKALRLGLRADRLVPGVEVRFLGQDDGQVVYGPVGAAELLGAQAPWWSPVLEGERARIEVFVPEGRTPGDAAIAIAAVSHLFVKPTDPRADVLAKDGSQYCEIDLICRSATDAALANVGKAVSKMTFTSGGSTYMCSGTLLGATGGATTPYYFSAAHCISTQAVATTLTTHWFYDRTGCGTGTVGASYVQLGSGATLLYANTTTDVFFARLNGTPPAGAMFAGWDSATLAAATPVTAVHHPAGDWKKVSLGSVTGFSPYSGSGAADHILVQWNSSATGVTEGGSSGSGIFTAVGAPATDYRLRGGLHGGASYCGAATGSLNDLYSRFDLAYPSLSAWLNAAPNPGTIGFAAAAISAPETAGTALLSVTRTGGTQGAVSVSYNTTGGTASAGVDYTPTSGVLNWADGDAATKVIAVPLAADGEAESDETFNVQLYSPTGGATIAGTNPAVVTIVDVGLFPPGAALPAGWSQPAGTDYGWVVASDSAYEGAYSLKSGTPPNTGAAGKRADVEVTTATGAGNVAFARRVSSEAGYDYLRFSIDGVEQASWAGQVAWSTVSYPVTQGMHTFRWAYTKDGSVDSNGDAAWIDAVTFPATGLDPAADVDNDGIPNGVEQSEGRNPWVKDNDLFSPGAGSARLFAMQQYRDFLSREGDGAGITGWTDAVVAGTYTRPQVVASFLDSAEFGGVVAPVVRLYYATFLRVPDYAGLTYNVGLVRNGTVTLTQLADFFTASPEFAAMYGALDNTAFVTLLYQNVLGRAPDQPGLDGWVALLNGGMSRGQVLTGFSESVEHRAKLANEVTVTMMYAGMLRRTPEPDGYNGWLAALRAGTAVVDMVNGFFLSAEYRARFLP